MTIKLVCGSCGDDLSNQRKNNLVRDPGRSDKIFCDSDCFMDYSDSKDKSGGTKLWDSEEEYQKLVALNAESGYAWD